MKSLRCFQTEILLEREAAGLLESERWLLEEHLQSCGACRRDARALRAIRGAMLAQHVPSTARERAIRRALDRSATERQVGLDATRNRSRRIVWALVGAAMVFVTFGVAFAFLDHQRTLPIGRPHESGVRPQDYVVSGEIRGGGRVYGASDSIPDGVLLEAKPNVVIGLGGRAKISFPREGRVQWKAKEQALALHAGEVELWVKIDRARRFFVTTEHFALEVTGTHFFVTPRSVRVADGSVHVSSRDGTKVLRHLQSGEAWEFDDKPPESSAEPVNTSSSSAASTARAGSKLAQEPPARAKTPSEELTQARRELSQGQVAKAKKHIAAALSSSPSRSQRAEAQMLLADAAQVDGDANAAVRHYLEVRNRYPDLPAAEVAWFAAARLQAKAGRTESARKLLAGYLKAHPNGRFVNDAKARLDALAR